MRNGDSRLQIRKGGHPSRAVIKNLLQQDALAATCENTYPEGAKDTYGDTCESWYDHAPHDCIAGAYDTDDFKVMEHCCTCEGGTTGVPYVDVSEESYGGCGWAGNSDVFEYSPDKGTCMDSAGDLKDSYGDGCEYYDQAPSDCLPEYNVDGGFQVDMCCACGGGNPVGEGTPAVEAEPEDNTMPDINADG